MNDLITTVSAAGAEETILLVSKFLTNCDQILDKSDHKKCVPNLTQQWFCIPLGIWLYTCSTTRTSHSLPLLTAFW